MIGARDYATIFKTGQCGRFYLVSGEHARGKTFRIFILPSEEDAIPNGNGNGPLNQNAVEVYGVVSGQPGWAEKYGWIHTGPWQNDFNDLVYKREAERARETKARLREKAETESANHKRIEALLAKY